MKLADTRKTLIRESYDQEAARYQTESQRQRACLLTLLSLAEAQLAALRPRAILDVGCGTGSAVGVFRERRLFQDANYLGIDLSQEMIALAKKNHGGPGIRFEAGDAEALNAEDRSTDLGVSNAMLHWLNQPKLGTTPLKAFSEIYRVIRPGGLFIASICGAGTALLFLKAYHETMTRYQETSEFDSSQYLEEPMGCMQLHEVTEAARKAGFKIELAQQHYHPCQYPSPESYLESIRALGFSIYTGPIPRDLRHAAWLEIAATFTNKAGPGPCLFELYENYLVARKI